MRALFQLIGTGVVALITGLGTFVLLNFLLEWFVEAGPFWRIRNNAWLASLAPWFFITALTLGPYLVGALTVWGMARRFQSLRVRDGRNPSWILRWGSRAGLVIGCVGWAGLLYALYIIASTD